MLTTAVPVIEPREREYTPATTPLFFTVLTLQCLLQQQSMSHQGSLLFSALAFAQQWAIVATIPRSSRSCGQLPLSPADHMLVRLT